MRTIYTQRTRVRSGSYRGEWRANAISLWLWCATPSARITSIPLYYIVSQQSGKARHAAEPSFPCAVSPAGLLQAYFNHFPLTRPIIPFDFRILKSDTSTCNSAECFGYLHFRWTHAHPDPPRTRRIAVAQTRTHQHRSGVSWNVSRVKFTMG